MLKILETKSEVIERLTELAEQSELENVRVGLVGSFARSQNKKSSKIDIILKTRDGHKDVLASEEIIEFINSFMKERYSNKINILWYDLIEEQEVRILEFLKEHNLDANPNGMSGIIAGEVQWLHD